MDEFFEWVIKEKDLSMTELAAVLGYSERHLYRIRNGEIENLDNFEARAIRHFGDDVRGFFLPRVTVRTLHATVKQSTEAV